MLAAPISTSATLKLPDQIIHYRIYRNPRAPARRLVMLHGGGVAGKLTWESIIVQLSAWSEILVPDLRGAGDTHYPDQMEHPFEIEEVAQDLVALVAHLGYTTFDVAGYSFGGLVTMVFKTLLPHAVQNIFLLEPALMSTRNQTEQTAIRERMLEAAYYLRSPHTLDQGLQMFLDAVSPNRSRGSRNEEIVRSRLAHRAAGLACAVESVSHAAKRLNRESLIAAQSNVYVFIGSRSRPETYRMCEEISASRIDWRCHLIQGTDHALPFQKPLAIAKLMNSASANN